MVRNAPREKFIGSAPPTAAAHGPPRPLLHGSLSARRQCSCAVYDIAIIAKDTLTNHLSDLPPDILEKVKIGLRARFDL
jgi:hypothetical protein